jgi:hypothetical protein
LLKVPNPGEICGLTIRITGLTRGVRPVRAIVGEKHDHGVVIQAIVLEVLLGLNFGCLYFVLAGTVISSSQHRCK